MNPKPVGIARGPRRDRVRSGRTFTPKSVRTGGEPNTTPKVGKSLAITLQSQATRTHLPGPPTPYKVPHSRTPAVSRANGNDGGLQTYSLVPLHLRGQILDPNDTNKHTDVRSSTTTADSVKVISDNTVKQTKVGRKIHALARFVQMIPAVVARNDIYGRTNCPHRNNSNL